MGGITGSLFAAYLTEHVNPHFSFTLCSFCGISIVISSYFLNKRLEERADRRSWTEVKNKVVDIFSVMKSPEIYRTLLYFFLVGALIPSYGDISYYFSINVVHFSKFTISMLTLLGFVSLMGGTYVYNRFF